MNRNFFGFIFFIVLTMVIASFTVAMEHSNDKMVKNVTIEKFFDGLDNQVIVHREHIPEDIRNKKIFGYVIVTTDRVSFKKIEKEMPDSIVLFTPNCDEFFIFTDYIKK